MDTGLAYDMLLDPETDGAMHDALAGCYAYENQFDSSACLGITYTPPAPMPSPSPSHSHSHSSHHEWGHHWGGHRG